MEFHHVSILLEPCLEALHIKPDGVYVESERQAAPDIRSALRSVCMILDASSASIGTTRRWKTRKCA